MSTILIRSRSKRDDNFILKLAKSMRIRAKILKEDDEMDLLLIKSIDEGMKSGEGSKEEVKKLLGKHGVKI